MSIFAHQCHYRGQELYIRSSCFLLTLFGKEIVTQKNQSEVNAPCDHRTFVKNINQEIINIGENAEYLVASRERKTAS